MGGSSFDAFMTRSCCPASRSSFCQPTTSWTMGTSASCRSPSAPSHCSKRSTRFSVTPDGRSASSIAAQVVLPRRLLPVVAEEEKKCAEIGVLVGRELRENRRNEVDVQALPLERANTLGERDEAARRELVPGAPLP